MHTFKARNAWVRKVIRKIADLITPVEHVESKWERKNKLLRLTGMRIGNNVAIDHGFHCLAGQEEYVQIDDNAAIGVGVRIWNFNEIRIGKFCMFAADVTLVNGGHDKNTFEPYSGPLVIGNGCWIGNGARIIGPLTIGNNAVVGAGAVVIKDVPEGCIVAGVPARIIGKRSLPEKAWHLGGVYFSTVTFMRVD